MSGLDVVDSVDNKVQVSPKVIIEDTFILRTDSQLDGVEIGILIDAFTYSAGSFALVFAYMLSAEQKLSIKVTDLYVVVVSDAHFASFG